jgi:hypothetical protein
MEANLCGKDRPQTRASTQIAVGLKIPRRKACRFESGLRHQPFHAIEAVAVSASHSASFSQKPSEPAGMTTDNGILAKVPGEYIGEGSKRLPAACAEEATQPERSVTLTVPQLGEVRLTYRLNSYRHGRSRLWHWRAVRADQA